MDFELLFTYNEMKCHIEFLGKIVKETALQKLNSQILRFFGLKCNPRKTLK